ncbi:MULTISPECIES: 5'-nucleotidase C-terminal domain-containing protein [unclassified Roseitalea]|uniref:5'-nucleotidase C-terminal domain-containing protein n=1 Tax=unclassified Roseitalea TaxID=2639107 RepID=UPI00273D8CE0|nr:MULTISPECIES: 5'-nucleotidase C-terminal domain-containing protein [unclassified Roseitalea]
MKKIALLAAASVSALALNTAMARAEFTLDILHINDLHSRIEPINRFDSTCSAEDDAAGECFGGVARVKTKIDERRSALTDNGGNVLVLDAGDQFQGSLFYTTYKGEAAAEFMNAIGFDVMAVGNHEFDDGPEALAEFMEQVEFPVISGNTLAGASSPLAGMLDGYVIKEVGGEQVGIVSVLATDTDETSSPGPTILLIEETRYLQDAVAEMEEAGVNKIILLSHVGLPRDREIAAAVDGIDLIVGGHSHTLLSNIDEDAAGPYPVVVQNPSGQDVPIVQAYAYSKYLGELRVVFDDDGNVVSAEGEPHLLDAAVTPDAEIAARVAELKGPIEEMMGVAVGEATGPIEGSREVCRAMECSMGNLVADAMLERVRDQGIQIAIQNGGGLRASIDAGEVTMGEVFTVLPFQNTLATFQLKGADIIAALENGVGQIEEGAGRFPQVAGLSYVFDIEAEPGSRISDVMVIDADGNATALDPEATYGVVSNNFMRNGGDGYAMFASNAMNAYDFGPGLEQVVADYLGENSPYEPYTDGRITAAADAMADDDMADEQAAAADDEPLVVPPETGLAADTLSTEGPTVEIEDDMADAAETPAVEEDVAEDIPTVVPPETSLAAETLSTEGPTLQAEEPMAEDQMAAEDAMAEDEMAAEEPMAEDEMAAEEPMAEDEMAAEDAMAEDEMAAEDAMAEDEMAAEEPMAEDEMAAEDAMAEDEMAAEDAMAEDEMAAEEPMAEDEMAAEEPMAEDEMAAEDAMAEDEMAAEDAMAEDDMAAEDAMDGMRSHTVVAGDTLWELAREYYGDATMWRTIAQANPDLSSRALPIGAELQIPAQ